VYRQLVYYISKYYCNRQANIVFCCLGYRYDLIFFSIKRGVIRLNADSCRFALDYDSLRDVQLERIKNSKAFAASHMFLSLTH